MKQLVASALMLLSPVLVMAQDAAPAPAKPAPKAAAKAAPAKDSKEAKKPAAKSTQSAKAAPAKDAKKPVHVAKAHPQSSRAQLKSATNQVASGLIAAEAALSPAELEIAQRVHTGHIPCELGASVNIEADPKSPGYFEVAGKNFHYRMTPVATSTGAVRLEDQKAGAVWIQISNKSMLMNQKLQDRLDYLFSIAAEDQGLWRDAQGRG
ncbi:hypothetical protein, partial [Paracidovorax avenae]|uniref:hypothetical protein n=1 Tax=Paracidovorax avenae TaxID=80867 RepID=UPI001CEF8736